MDKLAQDRMHATEKLTEEEVNAAVERATRTSAVQARPDQVKILTAELNEILRQKKRKLQKGA